MDVDLDQRVDRRVRELREVERARGRLTAGTYGVCADCGAAIEWQRLLAYPVAMRCVRRVQQHEKTHAHASTPML